MQLDVTKYIFNEWLNHQVAIDMWRLKPWGGYLK